MKNDKLSIFFDDTSNPPVPPVVPIPKPITRDDNTEQALEKFRSGVKVP